MASPGFLSKRERKKTQSGLTTDRYEYLGLEQAEADLGDPLVGISSIGAKPKPVSGDAFILAAYSTRSTTGISTNRFWISSTDLTSGLSLTPGSFTVFSNDVQVGLANSFNKFNFVGSGVTVDPVGSGVDEQTGIATIRISVTDAVAKGGFSAVQYHGAGGLIQGASDFSFNPNNNRVGIGSTLPEHKLDVIGNIIISGISTFTNGPVIVNSLTDTGTSDQKLQVTGGGYISGSTGIGTTSPTDKVDVRGTTKTENLNVTGVSTFTGTLDANGALDVDGHTELDDVNVSGAATAGSLKVTGLTTLGNLFATGTVTLASNSGLTTTGGNLTVGNNLLVGGTSEFIGIATFRGGTINLGDSTSDDINVGGEFTSNLVPNTDNDVDLGATSQRWRNIYASGIVTTQDLFVAGVSTFTGISTFNDNVTVKDDKILTLTNLADQTGSTGSAGATLVRNATGIVWSTDAISVSAGGTVGNIQFHSSAGLVGGDSGFNYDVATQSVGIGTSVPTQSLQVGAGVDDVFVVSGVGSVGIGTTDPGNYDLYVIGDTNIEGNLSVSGVSTINLGIQGTLVFGDTYTVGVGTTVVTGTATTTISSLGITSFRSIKYQVQIAQNSDFQATDILVLHNGTTSNLIEYGSIATGEYLGTFDTTVSGGNVNLNYTPNVSAAATVSIAYHGMRIL